MRRPASAAAIGAGFLILLSACTPPEEDPAHEDRAPVAAASVEEREVRPAEIEREMEQARERIVQRADSVEAGLRRVRALTLRERRDLRRDVNATHTATAQRLGVRAGGDSEIQRLVREGRLVPLEDSTEYWVVRELEHSVAYVTPDAHRMLMEIGRRFHARLDTLQLPRYRMQVTSVLRTAESQSDLRRRNSNAARGVSAHEFGTTLDVAHVKFSAPPPERMTVTVASSPEWTATMRYVEALALEEAARKQAAGLQGELGRVLKEMRAENKLRVMMERRQAVYHMTVARRFPRSSAVAGTGGR